MKLSVKLYILFIYLHIFVVGVGSHVTFHMWRSEDNLKEMLLSFFLGTELSSSSLAVSIFTQQAIFMMQGKTFELI